MTDLMIKRINPEGIHKPNGYTHVVETSSSKTIYISGQVALDKEGKLVGENNMRLQAKQIFENIQNALSSCNASFQNIVKLNYFITDMSLVQEVREIRDTFFKANQLPASTAVEVKSLFRKDVLLEIEAIAVI